MKTIKTNVYTLDELDYKAKDKARDWYRGGGLDYEWFDGVYEDAKTIGLKISGFDMYHQTIDGELTAHPEITANRILSEHGKKTATHKLAAAFLRSQKKGKLKDEDEETQRQCDLAEQFERDLLNEYLVILGKDWDYLNSNEAVDESLLANEYTFTKEGKRFG